MLCTMPSATNRKRGGLSFRTNLLLTFEQEDEHYAKEASRSNKVHTPMINAFLVLEATEMRNRFSGQVLQGEMILEAD